MNAITFKRATTDELPTIFSWLQAPHVAPFWDPTPAHKEDIVNFVQGRKTPSSYVSGRYVYWIASSGSEPYAMLMTLRETHQDRDQIGELKYAHLSKTGHTYGMDFMIGSSQYVGQGYGARTLAEFVHFFKNHVDPKADTFWIDPSVDNPRARHVYEKAGFQNVGEFRMEGLCSGSGKLHHLLVKIFPPEVSLTEPITPELARELLIDC